jgi:hypothetical protein
MENVQKYFCCGQTDLQLYRNCGEYTDVNKYLSGVVGLVRISLLILDQPSTKGGQKFVTKTAGHI